MNQLKSRRQVRPPVRGMTATGMLPELPDPPEGKRYRWVRVIDPKTGDEDSRNILRMEAAGWTFVKPETLSPGARLPVRSKVMEGFVGVGDVILAEIDAELGDALKQEPIDRAQAMTGAIDYQLERLRDRYATVRDESTQSISKGRRVPFGG